MNLLRAPLGPGAYLGACPAALRAASVAWSSADDGPGDGLDDEGTSGVGLGAGMASGAGVRMGAAAGGSLLPPGAASFLPQADIDMLIAAASTNPPH